MREQLARTVLLQTHCTIQSLSLEQNLISEFLSVTGRPKCARKWKLSTQSWRSDCIKENCSRSIYWQFSTTTSSGKTVSPQQL